MNYVKKLASLRAFLPDKRYVINLIKSCQLKHTDDWRIWTDEYGNSLNINNKKDVYIKLNSKPNNQTIISKDLYSKAHVSKLLSISKSALISIKEKTYYIWTLDKNNILRLSLYVDDYLITNQPVLISGASNLHIIMSNLNVEGWIEVDYIKEPLSNSPMDRTFSTNWPPKKELINMLPEIIQKDCKLV